jgi:ribonuclease HI
MAKNRSFYVVFKGRVEGIYETWAECEVHTKGFAGAKYKKYSSWHLAEAAYQNYHKEITTTEEQAYPLSGLCVDGACDDSGNFEFRCVDLESGKIIHPSLRMKGGTNNVAEFLGLVWALAYCKKRSLVTRVYSDSVTAIAWVRNKHARSTVNVSVEVKSLLSKAQEWLQNNNSTSPVIKWRTDIWGEIPADYGRKG